MFHLHHWKPVYYGNLQALYRCTCCRKMKWMKL